MDARLRWLLVVVLFLTAVSRVSAAIPGDFIHEYMFVVDANDTNGTSDAVVVGPGVAGGGEFNTSAGGYLTFPFALVELGVNDSFSVSFKVMMNSVTNGDGWLQLLWVRESTLDKNPQFTYDPSVDQLYMDDGTGPFVYATNMSALVPGAEYAMAWTYNGTTMVGYIDGVEVMALDTVIGVGPGNDTNLSDVMAFVDPVECCNVNGSLRLLRVYDRALTSAEVVALANEGAVQTEFNVTDCMNITQPGTYTVQNDINSTGANPNQCIYIRNGVNVTLDCQGFTLEDEVPGTTYDGISVEGNVSNVTVENCIVVNFTNGIEEWQVGSSDDLGLYVVRNNSVLSNQNGYEIYVDSMVFGGTQSVSPVVEDNLVRSFYGGVVTYGAVSVYTPFGAVVRNNNIVTDGWGGIYVGAGLGEVYGNNVTVMGVSPAVLVFADFSMWGNALNASTLFFIDCGATVVLNNTVTGNAYVNASGDAFSQTCTNNGFGICTLPYLDVFPGCLASDDYLPIALTSPIPPSPPVDTTGFDGATTNFSAVNVSAVDYPVLEKAGSVKIVWDGAGLNFSGANLSAYVTYGANWVDVQSANLPVGVNTSANVTLYGSYVDPVIKANGVRCQSCVVISNNGSEVVFSVPHFTNYSVNNQVIPGLVAYWPMDETSGNVIHEVINGFDGYVAGPVFATSMLNGSLASDESVASTVNVPFVSLNNLTVKFWIYHDEYGSFDVEGGFAELLGTSSSINPGYVVYYRSDALSMAFSDYGYTCEIPWSMVPLHAWSMLTATEDASSIRMYLNGASIANCSRGFPSASNSTNLTLLWGGYNVGRYAPNGTRMDEVMIFDRALNASEVQAIYANESVRMQFPYNVSAPACIANWTCAVWNAGTCRPSNTQQCNEVIDWNFCTVPFNGTLSAYDPVCSYQAQPNASVFWPLRSSLREYGGGGYNLTLYNYSATQGLLNLTVNGSYFVDGALNVTGGSGSQSFAEYPSSSVFTPNTTSFSFGLRVEHSNQSTDNGYFFRTDDDAWSITAYSGIGNNYYCYVGWGFPNKDIAVMVLNGTATGVHHVACVVDRDGAMIQGYVDGVLVGNKSLNGDFHYGLYPIMQTPVGSGNSLLMVGNPGGGLGSLVRDAFYVTRALTQVEVQNLSDHAFADYGVVVQVNNVMNGSLQQSFCAVANNVSMGCTVNGSLSMVDYSVEVNTTTSYVISETNDGGLENRTVAANVTGFGTVTVQSWSVLSLSAVLVDQLTYWNATKRNVDVMWQDNWPLYGPWLVNASGVERTVLFHDAMESTDAAMFTAVPEWKNNTFWSRTFFSPGYSAMISHAMAHTGNASLMLNGTYRPTVLARADGFVNTMSDNMSSVFNSTFVAWIYDDGVIEGSAYGSTMIGYGATHSANNYQSSPLIGFLANESQYFACNWDADEDQCWGIGFGSRPQNGASNNVTWFGTRTVGWHKVTIVHHEYNTTNASVMVDIYFDDVLVDSKMRNGSEYFNNNVATIFMSSPYPKNGYIDDVTIYRGVEQIGVNDLSVGSHIVNVSSGDVSAESSQFNVSKLAFEGNITPSNETLYVPDVMLNWSVATGAFGAVKYDVQLFVNGAVAPGYGFVNLSVEYLLVSFPNSTKNITVQVTAHDGIGLMAVNSSLPFSVNLSPQYVSSVCGAILPNELDQPGPAQMPVNMTMDSVLGFNASTASVTVFDGATVHTSTNCTVVPVNATRGTFKCFVPMNYYDHAAFYDVNASLNAVAGEQANISLSNICEYQSLLAFQRIGTTFYFPTAAPGVANAPANASMGVLDTGNTNMTLAIKAQNLNGNIHSNVLLNANAFRVGAALNGSAVMVANTTVPLGLTVVPASGARQNVSFWVTMSPSQEAQGYSSSTAWQLVVT